MEFTLLFVSALVLIGLGHGQAQLCPAAFGDFPAGNGCVTFVRCWRGQPYQMQCPANTAFDPIRRRCSNQQQVACVQNNQVAGPLIGGNGRAAAAAIGQLQQPAINQVQFAGFPGQPGGFGWVPGAGAGAGVGVNAGIGARGGSSGAAGVNGNIGANVGAGIGNQPQLLPAANPVQFPAWLQPQQQPLANPFLLPAANPAPLAGGNALVQPLQPQNAGNALLLPNGNINGGGFLNFPVGQGQPRGGQGQVGGGAAQAGINGLAGRGQGGIINPVAGTAGGAQGQGQAGGVGVVPLFTVNQSQTAKINQNQSVGAAPGK